VVSAVMLNSLDNADSLGEIMSNDFVTILIYFSFIFTTSNSTSTWVREQL